MPGAKSGMAGIEGRFFHSFECRENPADRFIDFNKDVSDLETGIRAQKHPLRREQLHDWNLFAGRWRDGGRISNLLPHFTTQF